MAAIDYCLVLGVVGILFALLLHSVSTFWSILLLVIGASVLAICIVANVGITLEKKRIINSRWFMGMDRWFAISLRGLLCLLGLGVMFGGVPLMIGNYPTARRIACQKIPAQPRLANCYVEMKSLAGWDNYRQDYAAVKQAKVIVINAKSSSVPGQARQRQNVIVQLYPAFLTDRRGYSHKIAPVIPSEDIATSVTTQINEFLQGSEQRLTIDLMALNWAQNVTANYSSPLESPQSHLVRGLIILPLAFLAGICIVLHNFFRLIGNPKFGDGE
jgi:amino acid transporter